VCESDLASSKLFWRCDLSDKPGPGCLVETKLFDVPEPRRVFDVERMAFLMAAQESAKFFMRHMRMAENHVTQEGLLEFALTKRTIPGLTLEFGVSSGVTFRVICETTEGKAYGFDTFNGLPEDWSHYQRTGRYTCNGKHPENLPANAEIIDGLFENTLPEFLKAHPEMVSFVHVDCDIYPSAKTVLTALAPRFCPGTIIVFNEFFNYPGWKNHEYKAFQEYIKYSKQNFEYFAFASSGQAVAVKLLD
jgi:hypothetical protein